VIARILKQSRLAVSGVAKASWW